MQDIDLLWLKVESLGLTRPLNHSYLIQSIGRYSWRLFHTWYCISSSSSIIIRQESDSQMTHYTLEQDQRNLHLTLKKQFNGSANRTDKIWCWLGCWFIECAEDWKVGESSATRFFYWCSTRSCNLWIIYCMSESCSKKCDMHINTMHQ